MSINGRILLRIIGDGLDFDAITNNIGLNPTNIYQKGKTYVLKSRSAKIDSWTYNIAFNKNEDPDSVMQKLLLLIDESKNYINEISNKYDVMIRCEISSNYGQMYVLFSSYTIKKMSEFNISLEMSILSFGEIEEI